MKSTAEKVIDTFVRSVIEPAAEAYYLMLILGGIHSFEPKVRAFGYWQIILILLAVGLVLRRLTSAVYERVSSRIKEDAK